MTRVSKLLSLVLDDYRINDKKSQASLDCRLKHLAHFDSMPAHSVGNEHVTSYIKKRLNDGAQNATINRELAALKYAFRLGYEHKPRLVRELLQFSRLKENPARKGFVRDAQYGILAECATELWLKGLLATGYEFGFRSGELTGLKVGQVDLKDCTICLDPGHTKNDEGRTIKMTTEVYDLLRQCVAGKSADDYVFTTEGKPVLDFRGAWWALWVKAGVGEYVGKDKRGKQLYEGLLFHDLRRSAVRNMVAAGIPDVVCMKITGHKSRSVFDRYNVVSTSDVAEATQKLENRKLQVKMQLTPKLAPAIQKQGRKSLKTA